MFSWKQVDHERVAGPSEVALRRVAFSASRDARNERSRSKTSADARGTISCSGLGSLSRACSLVERHAGGEAALPGRT